MNLLNSSNPLNPSSRHKKDEDILFDMIFTTLAENIAKLHVTDSSVQSDDNQIEQKKSQVLEELRPGTFEAIASINGGFTVLAQILPELLPKENLTRINNEVREAILRLSQLNPTQNANTAETFQKSLGFSNDTVRDFYSIAYNLFQHQEYQEASQIFDILTFLNPLSYDNWFARGLALAKVNKYNEALSAFAMATLLKPHIPDSRVHAIDAYFAINSPEDAEKEFTEVMKIVDTKVDKDAWQPWVSIIKQKLEHFKKV